MKKYFAIIIFLLNVTHESTYYGGIHIKCDNYVSYQEIKRRNGSRGGEIVEF